ncbi:MAG: type II toxin-antitoxin system VapC family toxin [Planctomycetes bacterium]|nr:type II toxin-antitoxin system VapC family toxin [Planctomycetota bacterium]
MFTEQPATKEVASWVEDDPDIVIWAFADVEVRSGLARLAREGRLSWKDLQEIGQDVDRLMQRVHVIQMMEAVKVRAKRLLNVHSLRAGDALQLGAALAACSDDPTNFEFLTLDQRLGDAARREGFTVRP